MIVKIGCGTDGALHSTNLYCVQVIESWVQQSGFPLVTVTRQYGDNTARVEQTRCVIVTSILSEIT